MPYIPSEDRISLLEGEEPALTPGELNFIISYEINEYLKTHGLHYATINDVIGALEGAKLEFYRTIAGPYEEERLQTNGDVYDYDAA